MYFPKISIVIPAYNAAKCIERPLLSLARQTYHDFEVIVVDDCSSDNTYNIAEKILETCGLNCKIIRLSYNQGVSCARNRGIQEADGKYVCFIDSDDAVKPEYLEKLVDKAEKENLDMVFCGFDEIDSLSGCFISRHCESIPELAGVKLGEEFFKAKMRGRVGVEMWTTLYKRSLLESANLWFTPHRKIGQDREFLYKALLESKRVSCLLEPLYIYYRHSDSTTRQNWYNKYRPCYDVGLYLQLIKYIKKKGYNSELVKLIERYSLARAALKMLSNFILHDEDEKFWKALRNEKIRQFLKYSYSTFLDKPEIPFKAFLALHFPKVFYRRYAKQRKRSFR